MIIRLCVWLSILSLAFLIGGLFWYNPIFRYSELRGRVEFAHKIENGHGGNCVEFRNLWLSLYPNSKVLKMRLVKGLNHYAIVLLETEKSYLLIDSNSNFGERIKIWRIDKNDRRIMK